MTKKLIFILLVCELTVDNCIKILGIGIHNKQ